MVPCRGVSVSVSFWTRTWEAAGSGALAPHSSSHDDRRSSIGTARVAFPPPPAERQGGRRERGRSRGGLTRRQAETWPKSLGRRRDSRARWLAGWLAAASCKRFFFNDDSIISQFFLISPPDCWLNGVADVDRTLRQHLTDGYRIRWQWHGIVALFATSRRVLVYRVRSGVSRIATETGEASLSFGREFEICIDTIDEQSKIIPKVMRVAR